MNMKLQVYQQVSQGNDRQMLNAKAEDCYQWPSRCREAETEAVASKT